MLQRTVLAAHALVAASKKSEICWLADHASTALGSSSVINHAITKGRWGALGSVDIVPRRAFVAVSWVAGIAVVYATLALSWSHVEASPAGFALRGAGTLKAVLLAWLITAFFCVWVQVVPVYASFALCLISAYIAVVLALSDWAVRPSWVSDDVASCWAFFAWILVTALHASGKLGEA